MKVIGVGLGRTGTYSLKAALETLGFGPCYHMEAVLQDRDTRVPQWNAAIAGQPDWAAIFDGYNSAVDWPTAGFYKELYAEYPNAKFILTTRDAKTWAESYGSTIAAIVADRENAPPDMRAWLEMANNAVMRTGFPDAPSRDELAAGFTAHIAAVKAAIPENQLLDFQVKQGWGPLCEFLGTAVPNEPFPRTNDRKEFFELVAAGT